MEQMRQDQVHLAGIHLGLKLDFSRHVRAAGGASGLDGLAGDGGLTSSSLMDKRFEEISAAFAEREKHVSRLTAKMRDLSHNQSRTLRGERRGGRFGAAGGGVGGGRPPSSRPASRAASPDASLASRSTAGDASASVTGGMA